MERREEGVEPIRHLEERKSSWAKLRRVDSLNLEAGRISTFTTGASKKGWSTTLLLAFQCIGVIYGDIGTSPLYVFSSTFRSGISHGDDVFGALSLIIYTLVLVSLLKYVFIVLLANDNGDGGTFALYSLICRYAKVGLIPTHQPEDRELSNYILESPSNQMKRAHKIKEKLENSKIAKVILFLVTILGTSMVIGDGVLTPSISVLSAVSGIKSLGQNAVVGVSVAILVILFSGQQFGTDRIGYSFAPIIFLWFLFIGSIGVYNLFKYEVAVLRAFSPKYIVDYFKRNGKDGWISLGGIVLCITGTEAMFADLGHFSVRAVQISFSSIVLPALLAAYCGQAAYLTKFPDDVGDTFYKSVPDGLYWPTFVAAILAAIIASQAMISGAFSIISQSLALNCFPSVKVVHTSAKYEGQVYIPEVNYMLMIACVIVTVAFKTTEEIGNAYGIAVVAVMLITTTMVTLIMLVIWKISIWWIIMFFLVFGSMEAIYFSSVLVKFKEGGFLPLTFSAFLMMIMWVWHYVHKEKYMFELKNKVSSERVRDLVTNPLITRMPGIGLLYSELVQGIPPIFPHFLANVPCIHSVVVFVSIKVLPISRVILLERFLFRQVEPRDNWMFRCVVRYGYNDKLEEAGEFERQLVENLRDYIHQENFVFEGEGTAHTVENELQEVRHLRMNDGNMGSGSSVVHAEELSLSKSDRNAVSLGSIRCVSFARHADSSCQGAEHDMSFFERAKEKGVVYLLGEVEVMAQEESSLLKKIVVNYAYDFLRKNFRQAEKVMFIPQSKLLRVGMTYEI